jgi:ubiquinone/menaquinone biosynthesis C-methylase UbiE
LPFEDNSIDFVRASSIFLSLETEQLKHNLAEIARVIKPGGVFVFEDLFYNRYCPMNILDNVLNKARKSKLDFGHLKQYSLREIKRLLKNSQLSQKCPQYTIKPHKPALLQEKFGNVGMRVSNDINKEINPPKFLKEFLACGYSVYSKV